MNNPIIKLCACGCQTEFISYYRQGQYTQFIQYHGVRKVPLSKSVMDLTIPHYAYMFGFFQSDSHFREQPRNRGCLQVELGITDRSVLEKFKEIIPVNSQISERVRDTNFRKNYHSVIWKVHDIRFRTLLENLGLPYGKKCQNIYIPDCELSKPDYYRGLVDGDGSLGFTKEDKPFISLCTSSDSIAMGYMSYIKKIVGKTKNNKRNTRDNAYNIMLNVEDAQLMVSSLYYDGCLALDRKLESASNILAWARPPGMRRIPNKKFWDDEQDAFILTHTVEESMAELDRSERSIRTRLVRLKNPTKYFPKRSGETAKTT